MFKGIQSCIAQRVLHDCTSGIPLGRTRTPSGARGRAKRINQETNSAHAYEGSPAPRGRIGQGQSRMWSPQNVRQAASRRHQRLRSCSRQDRLHPWLMARLQPRHRGPFRSHPVRASRRLSIPPCGVLFVIRDRVVAYLQWHNDHHCDGNRPSRLRASAPARNARSIRRRATPRRASFVSLSKSSSADDHESRSGS